MATTFPTSVDSFATNVDGVSIVTAADMNNVQDAITALETFIGVNPPPDYLNTANALVRRGSDGSFAGNDIVAVGEFTSTGAGGGGDTSNFYAVGTTPSIGLRRTGSATNEKLWDVYLSATEMIWRMVADNQLSATDFLKFTRNGITPTAIAVLTAMSVSQILVASSGVAVPRTNGAATFAIDAASTGTSMTVANAAASYIFGNANNFSGLILVNETSTDKSTAAFLVGGAFCVMIGDTNSQYAASNTASKSCVYLSGNAPVIHNNRGASRTYNIVAFRAAAAN